MYQTLKYIFGFGIIISGIFLAVGLSVFGGLLVILSGFILLPPISGIIKNKLSFWKNRSIRIVSVVGLCFVGFALAGSQTNSSKMMKFNSAVASEKQKEAFAYEDYLKESQIGGISEKQKQKRLKMIEALKQNGVYQKLVDSAVVKPEFLPVVNAVANGITGITEDSYGVQEDLIVLLENSHNGEEKIDFVVKTVFLALPSNGGLTKELIQAFENYRKRYGYYGTAGRFYSSSGKEVERVNHSYDLTPIFGILEMQDEKVLDAIYEAKSKGITQWMNNEENLFAFLSSPKAYIKHLKSYYPQSDVLPEDWNDDFWQNYDVEVNNRILSKVILEDCEGLQEEFNIADENNPIQVARTGSNNSRLMLFIDDIMREMNCYN